MPPLLDMGSTYNTLCIIPVSPLLLYSGLFSRGKISRMPSGAIIHEENFHECMAVTNTTTLTSAISQGKFSRIKLNSLNS